MTRPGSICPHHYFMSLPGPEQQGQNWVQKIVTTTCRAFHPAACEILPCISSFTAACKLFVLKAKKKKKKKSWRFLSAPQMPHSKWREEQCCHQPSWGGTWWGRDRVCCVPGAGDVPCSVPLMCWGGSGSWRTSAALWGQNNFTKKGAGRAALWPELALPASLLKLWLHGKY